MNLKYAKSAFLEDTRLKKEMNPTIVSVAKLLGVTLSNINYIAEYLPLLTRL